MAQPSIQSSHGSTVSRRELLLWIFLSVATAAQARAATSVLHGNATIQFTGRSTLHEFSGQGRALPFELKGEPGQLLEAEVEVPVRSLDTDNGWRDEKMREMLHAETNPIIRGHFAALDGAAIARLGRMSFDLTICGVTQRMVAQISDWRQGDESVDFTATFDVSLAAFALSAPGALLLKVDDVVHVSVRVTVNQA